MSSLLQWRECTLDSSCTVARKRLLQSGFLPLSSMPEGTVCCNIEAYPGDRGKISKCSGDYAVIITQDEDKGTTRIRLPSGSKKTLNNQCRAVVGIVAGGG